jgi:biopolymer transport protein ExbD
MKQNAYIACDALPMSELNTTPLIDVMLVLLIMMILNIPLPTHSTAMDLPKETAMSVVPRKHHVLVIGFDGQLTWDGQPVSWNGLASAFQKIGVAPESLQDQVRIRPDSFSRYDTVLKVLALAQKHKIKDVAFIGNELYANP